MGTFEIATPKRCPFRRVPENGEAWAFSEAIFGLKLFQRAFAARFAVGFEMERGPNLVERDGVFMYSTASKSLFVA